MASAEARPASPPPTMPMRQSGRRRRLSALLAWCRRRPRPRPRPRRARDVARSAPGGRGGGGGGDGGGGAPPPSSSSRRMGAPRPSSSLAAGRGPTSALPLMMWMRTEKLPKTQEVGHGYRRRRRGFYGGSLEGMNVRKAVVVGSPLDGTIVGYFLLEKGPNKLLVQLHVL